MAITGKTSINGQVVDAAYGVITSVDFRAALAAIVTLSVYNSEADYVKGLQPLTRETRSIEYDGVSAPWDFFEKAIIANGVYAEFVQTPTSAIDTPAPIERPSALITSTTTAQTIDVANGDS